MNQLLALHQKTVNNLPLSTRIILLSITLGFVFIIWYYGFWRPIQDSISKKNLAIQNLEKTIPLLKVQLKTNQTTLKNKEEQETKNKLESYLKTKNTPENKLVSPKATRQVLQDLLAARYGLTLIQLYNLQPKEAIFPGTDLKIFEHTIIIQFYSDYFSTMSYLQAIENLNWRIFWDRLEYKVVEYPTAKVTLQIHTLSDQEEWLNT